MSIAQRLRDLAIELPDVPAPVGNYVGAVQVGNFDTPALSVLQCKRRRWLIDGLEVPLPLRQLTLQILQ